VSVSGTGCPARATRSCSTWGRERGARCDEIPDSPPGIGYVAEDGTAELIRVRAFELTDTDIDWLAATYRPRPTNDDTQTGDQS
jgi:DNA segregation ATPase FtsK/SpoIIIE, S-DNA-T family